MNKVISLTLISILLFTGCGGTNENQGKQKNSPSPQQSNSAHPPQVEKVKSGDRLVRETPDRQQQIETLGFLEPTDPKKAAKDIREVGDHLTYVSFFSYQVKPDGGLIPLKDESTLNVARKQGTVPMLVITNFAEGNFQPDIAHRIFTDSTAKKRLIQNVIRVMKQKGYSALNIDFEHIREQDRQLYHAFLETILPAVKKEGFAVSTALAPKTSDQQTGPWHGAHDYAFHGKVADFVILMTYEWGWTGGPPMAVSPLPQVRKVLDYAVSKIPREKIMLGAPLYGYDWILPYRKGGPPAKRLAPQEAADLARKRGAEIRYNNRDQAPYFFYQDQEGKKHVVWFENAQSAQARFNLVKEYRIRGIGYWVLGEAFPDQWNLLQDNFKIKKY